MQILIKCARFIERSFAYWILAFALTGFIFPEIFIGLKGYVNYLLGMIMFTMGLTLKLSDFNGIIKQPKQVAIGVLGQFIIMPLVALGLTQIFNLDPMLTIGILLVGCCPGGTASNVITFIAKGDLALSVTITSVTTLLAPIATPFLLQIITNENIDIQFFSMMKSIVNIMLIPIILGSTIRMIFGNKKLDALTPILPLFSVAGIVLIVAIIVGLNQLKIKEVGFILMILIVLHNSLGFLIGYYLAKYTGLNLAQRKTIAIEVGMQNSGLAASLALAYFSPLAAVPGALFSVWHNISGSIFATIFNHYEQKNKS